jgi:lambda repressor-like predicted transcriptional regulator
VVRGERTEYERKCKPGEAIPAALLGIHPGFIARRYGSREHKRLKL